jgi:hypothetical protein
VAAQTDVEYLDVLTGRRSGPSERRTRRRETFVSLLRIFTLVLVFSRFTSDFVLVVEQISVSIPVFVAFIERFVVSVRGKPSIVHVCAKTAAATRRLHQDPLHTFHELCSALTSIELNVVDVERRCGIKVAVVERVGGYVLLFHAIGVAERVERVVRRGSTWRDCGNHHRSG